MPHTYVAPQNCMLAQLCHPYKAACAGFSACCGALALERRTGLGSAPAALVHMYSLHCAICVCPTCGSQQ